MNRGRNLSAWLAAGLISALSFPVGAQDAGQDGGVQDGGAVVPDGGGSGGTRVTAQFNAECRYGDLMHWAAESGPANVVYRLGGDVPDGMVADAAWNAIRAAFQTWDNVPCAAINFTEGAQITNIDGAPGANEIWVFFDTGFTSNNTFFLGFGTAGRNPEYAWVKVSVNSAATRNWTWVAQPLTDTDDDGNVRTYDLQSVMLTAVGKAVGLTNAPAGTDSAIGLYESDDLHRVLYDSDRAGLQSLYPDDSCTGNAAQATTVFCGGATQTDYDDMCPECETNFGDRYERRDPSTGGGDAGVDADGGYPPGGSGDGGVGADAGASDGGVIDDGDDDNDGCNCRITGTRNPVALFGVAVLFGVLFGFRRFLNR